MRQRSVISVIVPVYNTAPFLRECLDSIASQTYELLDIILIDDGSTDNSLEICREYAAADNRFRIITLPGNQGQSAARNAGLAKATGDYITFVDSDDVISPGMIESLYKLLKPTTDMSAVRFTRFISRPSIKRQQRYQTGEYSASAILLNMLYQSGFTPSVCGKLFTRTSLDGMQFTTGKLYEDLDFMARYLERTSWIATSTAALYHYRRNPSSTLGTFRPKRLDVLDVTKSIIDRADSNPKLLRAARDRHLSASFNMFALLCRNGMAGSKAADRCWLSIRSLRSSSLLNPRVRIKNKVGIIASLTGRRIFTIIARYIHA